MDLKTAQRAADKAWAAWQQSPSPATNALLGKATADLRAAQDAAWDGTEWQGSPDTQPR